MRNLSRVAVLLPALVTLASGQGSSPGNIPEVHAATLTGVSVDLPHALQGKAGVLVIGFSQASREEVAAWGRRLAQDFRDSHDVAYYEMAELQSVPRPLRGWVQHKIAGSVPDRAKAHFIVLNDHESEWKQVSGFADSDHAYVLLIDRGGAVRFRTQGPASDGAYAALKQRVEALTPAAH